ncbi:MAG TPA: hypothetical protein VFA02_11875, partial [Pseudacidobacterium sp.]|nr:hypothetical protein [Pseudacidobacterium sp.]
MKLKDLPFSISVSGAVVAALLVAGCARQPSAANDVQAARQAQQQARAAEKAQMDAAREALDAIPLPAKSRYMAVRNTESWSNPFLIVGSENVTLRVVYPDVTHNNALPSTMLKPAKARRQELTIRLSDLPDALSSLPNDEWPYGRVVAVEEDPLETRANRLQVRRNIETTMQVLNNLGVVVYE